MRTNSTNASIKGMFNKHPIIFVTTLILLCWLPWLLAAYPGTTDPNDTLDQLQQWHGIASASSGNIILNNPDVYVNSHHPILHTVLLNLAIDLGGQLHSQNVGLFVFVCIQGMLLSIALAASIFVMRKLDAPTWVWAIALSIYCLCPVYGGWAVSVTKDTLFSAAMVAFVSILGLISIEPERYTRKRYLLLFAMLTLIVCLLRSNGLLSVVFGLFALCVATHGKVMLRFKFSGLFGLVVSLCITLVVYPSLGFSGTSPREALSVPLQQTARYIIDYGDDVTDAECGAIAAIIDFDQIAENYRPDLSDPIKNTFKPGSEDYVAQYLVTWFKMGFKHPDAYITAFVELTYLYYLPGQPTGWLWLNMNHFRTGEGLNTEASTSDLYYRDGFYLHQNSSMQPARDFLLNAYLSYRHTPVLRFPGDMGSCTWILIVSIALIARSRKTKFLIPLMPLFALLLVVLLGPMNGNIRYMLPVIYLMPLTVALLVSSYRLQEC